MKIAIATDAGMVSRHFGHCEGFTLFTVEEGKVTNQEFLANPGHKKGFLPVFLHDHGVEVIISGGMGQGAIDIFNANDIEVITGAMGSLDKNIEDYMAGKLVSTGSVCHQHQHAGECGEHGEHHHHGN